MFYQSKKKRLWRARVTQPASSLQQEQYHQHQHQQQVQVQQYYHQQQQQQQQQQQRTEYLERYTGNTDDYCPRQQHYQRFNITSPTTIQDNHVCNSDYEISSNVCPENVICGQEGSNGCCCENIENSLDAESGDHTISSTMSTSNTKLIMSNRPTTMMTMSTRTTETMQPMTATATATATATSSLTGNVFRNCCGGGSNMSNSTSMNNLQMETASPTDERKELFRALINKLKDTQLKTLCQVIDNGLTQLDRQQSGCVLVPRAPILGEEPNVIACQIWRWPDLRCSTELKSIPSCPSVKDPVYVCCNPTHWSRVCLTDLPPPPYHQPYTTEKQKSEEDKNVSVSSDRNYQLQFPESLTTDGEDSSSSSWCQLAYWELAQRVGGLFPVENSSVNIFSDQPRGEGMCLKTLAEQRQSTTPESVLKARQKIGLGITLSQESDCVWLYNRSSAPVFVHSPTLNDTDYCFHVSKVPPGYCLKAFDGYKAKIQSKCWPSYIAGAQTGPVDTHSMRISFAKGWGPNYSRQDVTACPCWLEVLFPRR